MAKVIKAVHKGDVAQAVRVVGGTVTVWPGQSVEIEGMVALNEEQIAHFKRLGVTFDDGKAKKGEKAETKAAEAAVVAARKGVEDAGDDLAAKAEAEKVLAAAEAELAALKD